MNPRPERSSHSSVISGIFSSWISRTVTVVSTVMLVSLPWGSRSGPSKLKDFSSLGFMPMISLSKLSGMKPLPHT